VIWKVSAFLSRLRFSNREGGVLTVCRTANTHAGLLEVCDVMSIFVDLSSIVGFVPLAREDSGRRPVVGQARIGVPQQFRAVVAEGHVFILVGHEGAPFLVVQVYPRL